MDERNGGILLGDLQAIVIDEAAEEPRVLP